MAVDIGSDEEAVAKYNVMSIPTMVLIDEDGTELGRLRGARTRDEVEDMLYDRCFIEDEEGEE